MSILADDWGKSDAARRDWLARHAALHDQLTHQSAAGYSKWAAPTLLNSWANYSSTYSPAGYYIDGSQRLWLRGQLAGGASGTVAFQLPISPPYNLILPGLCAQGGSLALAQVYVDTSGHAMLLYYGSGSLNWFTLECSSFSLLP